MGKKLVRVFILCWSIFMTNNILNAAPSMPPPYIFYVREIIKSFTSEMKKEHGLICESSGGSMPHDVQEIDVGFVAFRKATIEEARELEITAINKLLNKINTHEKIRPFLREYPFKGNRVRVSISFEKKFSGWDLDSPISYINQGREGRLFYSKAEMQKSMLPGVIDNETKQVIDPPMEIEDLKLVDIFEESLDEAFSKVGLSAFYKSL